MGKTTHQKFTWVDYVVSGEVDSFISELCQMLLKHKRNTKSEDLPKGVFGPIHRKTGYPVGDNSDKLPVAITASLAGLPAPDYDDYFDELYCSSFQNLIFPAISFEMSRGCWWGQCTFCGLSGCRVSFRSKPADQVLQELMMLVERYDTTRISVVDNVVDMDYFDTLIPRMSELEKDLEIFLEVKANLTRRQIEKLRVAGVRWINPGIESLHSRILKLIRKGVSAWQNIQMLKWCRQNGIATGWNMLFGFPGEKDEWYDEMAEWIPLLVHLPPGFFLYVQYCRYSTYFDNADNFGLDLQPTELSRSVFPMTKEEITDLAYHLESESTPDYHICLGNSHFPDRSGLEAVHMEMLRWRMNWGYEKPVLCMREANGALEISDSRPCSMAPSHRIDGLERDVLEQCDDALTIGQLCSVFEQKYGITSLEVREALADLVDRKLVLEIDGRAISLVLKDPIIESPNNITNPSGLFLVEEFQGFK